MAIHLESLKGIDVEILPFLHKNKHLLESGCRQKLGGYFRQVKKTTLARFLINSLLFESVNHLRPPDIVHRTYYGNINFGYAKYVTTIHDFIPEKYPYQFDDVERFIRLKRKAILESDHVICVSNATKQDLLSYYPIVENKLSVIHHASSLNTGPLQRPTCQQRINEKVPQKPYLLYVGDRSGYKNFDTLLRALSQSNKIRKDFSMICFGGLPFDDKELKRMADLHLDLPIEHLTGDDQMLSKLYQNATLFVHPSLYEGFGISILEAMSLGCPVVCSDLPVFQEVTNDAAAKFDPAQASSICHTLETVLYANDQRKKLITKGHENEKRFSWKKTAEKTLSIYRQLNAE
ncbi:MAG: glycosyltransferase family 4 protein [Desulfatitalea sp.]|nr:glycosyltransferase family 4 protein [Desulfatitalea sp.]